MPAGVAAAASNEFYIYVSHYKSSASGVEATNQFYRSEEAAIIRNNEATALPSNARVLYVGDYNIGGSGEASYLMMLSNSAPNGISQGAGIDPFNTNGAAGIDYTANTLLGYKSESSTSLHYRDDFQVMTTNIYYGTPGGLTYVQGTYHSFGNNGTTGYESSVNSGGNTSLTTNLGTSPAISASTLYSDLTTASDHLPIVADYLIPVPDPPVVNFSGSPQSGAAPLTVTFTDTST